VKIAGVPEWTEGIQPLTAIMPMIKNATKTLKVQTPADYSIATTFLAGKAGNGFSRLEPPPLHRDEAAFPDPSNSDYSWVVTSLVWLFEEHEAELVKKLEDAEETKERKELRSTMPSQLRKLWYRRLHIWSHGCLKPRRYGLLGMHV
jgi:hypothetical protein